MNIIIPIGGIGMRFLKDNYNLNLSEKRAEAIKDYFLENGVSNLITSKGFGESDPKYDNTDANIKTKNRRVEIYFNN